MRARATVISLALLLGPGCSVLKPHADPTRYFVLTPAARPTPPSSTAPVLGIDRVELPEYLQRPELVSRSAANQLHVAEYDQWGEPLKEGFARTLRQDLEKELGAGQVLAAPYDPSHRPQLVADVDVRRFERVDGQGAVLEARWTLRDAKSGATLATRDTRTQLPVAGDDPQATVAALSGAVAALAGEVAGAARRGKDVAASGRQRP